MKLISSIAAALLIVGFFSFVNSFGMNLWLSVTFFVMGYCLGLTMLLVPVPLVLFTLTTLLAGAGAITINISQDFTSVGSGLGLALAILSLHYFVWIRSPYNE
jgi:hypothetical protein